MFNRRLLAYLWSSPTTLVGLPLAVAAILSGGRARWLEGVLEVHGGLACKFLRHCTLLGDGALAMTLGHVVLGRDQQVLDDTRAHERAHVRQAEVWGPLFIPVYLLASLAAALRGGDYYLDNRFEVEAREAEARSLRPVGVIRSSVRSAVATPGDEGAPS